MNNTITVVVKREENKLKQFTEKLACVYLTLLIVSLAGALINSNKKEKEESKGE